MTDEKFEQILKQALTPKNEDSELEIKMRVRTYDMKKLLKRVIAVAACAAICLSGYGVTNYLMDASLEKVSNTFIVKAYAQELTSDNSIPITIGEESGNGYVMGGSEKDGHVSYCINLPLSCEGENIKNITYSINKGCFQIIEPADKTYLVDYIEHTENMEFGKCGGLGDEEVDSDLWPEEKELYLDSFTVDYNNQVGEDFWINIGNVVPNMYEIIWSEKDSIEEQAEADNMLLSDIKINVTVTFEDGTQSSKTIGLETKIVDKRPEKSCRAIEFFIKEL